VRTPNASQNAVAQSRLAFIGVANVHLSNGVASAFKVAFFDFLEIACGAEIGCLEPDPPSPKGDPPLRVTVCQKPGRMALKPSPISGGLRNR
jgi:hypothetical protein